MTPGTSGDAGRADSVQAHVARARARLERAGIASDEAALDARLLAQCLLGWDSLRFVTSTGESWPANPPDLVARYEALVSRRKQREPLAYITGQREFWNLEFEVTPAVLIPRPETELLVETALELVPDRAALLRIADVCTGSGCLAVALAHEYSHAQFVATDISPEALGVASRNVVRHGVAGRVELVATDLLPGSGASFDLVVSNPPYVPESERDTLQPEVRDYEPAVALFAGADGMTIINRLVVAAQRKLTPHGLLLFEFGFGQTEAVEGLISHTPGLTMVGLKPDLQGIPRVAIVRTTHLTRG